MQTVVDEHAVWPAGNDFISILEKEGVCALYLVHIASAPRVVFWPLELSFSL